MTGSERDRIRDELRMARHELYAADKMLNECEARLAHLKTACAKTLRKLDIVDDRLKRATPTPAKG